MVSIISTLPTKNYMVKVIERIASESFISRKGVDHTARVRKNQQTIHVFCWYLAAQYHEMQKKTPIMLSETPLMDLKTTDKSHVTWEGMDQL